MSTDAVESLSELIRKSGQSWLIESWPDKPAAVLQLRTVLDNAYREYFRRYGPTAASEAFSDQVLIEEQKANPDRVQAFFQAVGEIPSPQELVMAWRIIQGDTIKRVDLHYVVENVFSLSVELEDAIGRTQVFNSNEIETASFFRHWGILRLDDRPVFAGFDPLRIA